MDMTKFTKRAIQNAKKKLEQIKKTHKWNKIELKIDNHIPLAAKRPRSGKFGNFYVPDAAKNKRELRKILQDQIKLNELIKTEIHLKINTYHPIPKSFSDTDTILAEKGVIRPSVKPDPDNIAKPYMDALSGFVWEDDAQVTDLHISKFYSLNPRVEITIKYRNIFLSSILASYKK